MTRKSLFVLLSVLVVLSLVLAGCKKSATPPLVGDIQAENEAEKMLQEAGTNPTPVVVAPATAQPTAAPVAAATAEAPTAEPTTIALPVVVEGSTEAKPEATPAPVAVSALGKHTVQVNENLFRIALRYGVTVEAVAKANGITNPALINVGQVLTIPGGTPGGTPAPTPVPPSSGGKVHIVQPGENLFRIALKYNYSQYYLAKYNGIANPALIYVGQTIRIP